MEVRDNGFSKNNFDRPTHKQTESAIISEGIGTVIVQGIEQISRNSLCFKMAERYL
jgi:hypothetical protein